MALEVDLELLRRTMELARQAHERGDHPFGALLADERGHVILEGQNTVESENDITAHAELNLLRRASMLLDPEQVASATLYASTEPCPMCSGAIHWSGVSRVVYGLSQIRLYQVASREDPVSQILLSCRHVLSHSGREIELHGPLLEEEAEVVHQGAWSD